MGVHCLNLNICRYLHLFLLLFTYVLNYRKENKYASKIILPEYKNCLPNLDLQAVPKSPPVPLGQIISIILENIIYKVLKFCLWPPGRNLNRVLQSFRPSDGSFIPFCSKNPPPNIAQTWPHNAFLHFYRKLWLRRENAIVLITFFIKFCITLSYEVSMYPPPNVYKLCL